MKIWVCVLLALFVLGGCKNEESEKTKKPPLEARGPEATEERPIGPFAGIVVPGKASVTVKKGATGVAKLRGPANFLAALKLRAEKRTVGGKEVDVLVIELKKRMKFPLPEVEISTPALVYVDASGASRVTLDDFTGPELTLLAGGAARIQLAAGAYAHLIGETKMAARISAPEVMAEHAELKASGPSRIVVGQVAQLKRTTVDGGSVGFKGKPELLQ